MARVAQRHRQDSVMGAVAQFQRREVSIPPSMEKVLEQDPALKQMFAEYTSLRTADNWRDVELFMVFDAVKLRRKLDILDLQLAVEADVLSDDKGKGAINPLWTHWQNLHKLHDSKLRACGIFDVAQQARTNGSIAIKDIDPDDDTI